MDRSRTRDWSGPLIDRILTLIDPHQPQLDSEGLQVRVRCGRWLALRRMRRHLTLDALGERLALPPVELALLEAGVADAGHFYASRRALLAALLSTSDAEPAPALILGGALGEAALDACTAALLDADLATPQPPA